MKKNLILTGVIISILVFSITVCLQIEGQIEQEHESAKLSALSTHGPIDIKSNADFSSYAIISGDGSPGDPFVIDSLNITVVSGIGISISTVSVHFIIQNCFIKADTGIMIDASTSLNSSIIGNTLEPLAFGTSLYLNWSSGLDIIDNTFISGNSGIFADHASDMNIMRNTVSVEYYAIDFIDCHGVLIAENTFEESEGDQYFHCYDLELYNNSWINNNHGLIMEHCDTCDVRDNIFFNNSGYGVNIISASLIQVINNWFVCNNIGQESQARESISSFIDWSLGGVGNFWSDYNGILSKYAIDEGGYDYYPRFDTDGDELNDFEETFIYFTDVNDIDTDDDSIPDFWEAINLLDPLVDDTTFDPDLDGLSNLDEYLHGCNPQLADSDSDSIPDGYEVFNSLNPLIDDAHLDHDGDGLTNYEEYFLGTKANNYDSDEDGMSDLWEFLNGLNPLLNDAWDDPDNDSLNNFMEYIYGCDPFNNDTDGDSHQDGWEILHGTNPNNPYDFPDESMETVESSFALFFGIFAVLLLSGLFLRRKR